MTTPNRFDIGFSGPLKPGDSVKSTIQPKGSDDDQQEQPGELGETSPQFHQRDRTDDDDSADSGKPTPPKKEEDATTRAVQNYLAGNITRSELVTLLGAETATKPDDKPTDDDGSDSLLPDQSAKTGTTHAGHGTSTTGDDGESESKDSAAALDVIGPADDGESESKDSAAALDVIGPAASDDDPFDTDAGAGDDPPVTGLLEGDAPSIAPVSPTKPSTDPVTQPETTAIAGFEGDQVLVRDIPEVKAAEATEAAPETNANVGVEA